MIAQRSIFRSSGHSSLFNQAFRVFGARSDRPINALFSPTTLSHIPQQSDSDFPGFVHNLKDSSSRHAADVVGASSKVGSRFLGNLGMKLGFVKSKENASSPSAISCRSFIHTQSRKGDEMGRSARSMDFVRGIIEEDGKDNMRDSRYHVDQNADVVHIKMLRNNTFVTLTDSKGNTKAKASTGSLSDKGGAKASRYAAEATAEHIGRVARNMGIRSVVVKVNGFTYFKKKKQAILSFREGYTYGRGDQNPIVHIEDTTRKPHNGCRLKKKRRV